MRHGRSKSFKVIKIGTSRKPICDFLLVFHCNCMCIFCRFINITISDQKSAFFRHPTSVSFEALGRRFASDLRHESWCLKTRVAGLPDAENCSILRSLVLTHFQRVTDGQADRLNDTPPIDKSRCSNAERDDNGCTRIPKTRSSAVAERPLDASCH